MLTRTCLALWLAVTSSASALPYQEKIIPLIAPLAGVTADKKLAYTDTFIMNPHTIGYEAAEVLNIINLRDFSKKIYSIDGGKFNIKDILDENNAVRIRRRTYEPKLLLLDIIGTQKITPELLIYSSKVNLPPSWSLPITTENKKYILRASNNNIYIRTVKSWINNLDYGYSLLPISQKTSEDASDNIASVIINKKMNRVMVAGEDLQLYKIDFSHLSKTYAEMETNLIYGPAWTWSGGQKFIKVPDPKDPERKTFSAYKSYLSLSPDDNYVAGGFHDDEKKIKGWVRSINTGLIRYLLTDDYVLSSSWSPNGKYLATLGDYISIRDTKTGKTIQTIGTKGPEIDRGPFFTQDGKLLFSDKNFDMHVVTLP